MKKIVIAIVIAVIVIIILVLVAPGSPKPVDIQVSGGWANDLITVEVITNVPDGAVFQNGVLEGTDWDDLDAAYHHVESTVDGGGFAFTVNVDDFAQDIALISITFAPWATTQPQSISRLYRDGARLELKQGVDAEILPGPPANPDRKMLEVECILTRS
jgi:hypothetical protein